jgi:hypothetical protein
MSRPRLVVHFDVNKTILFTDEASGQGVDQLLNGVIASHAWGVVPTG